MVNLFGLIRRLWWFTVGFMLISGVAAWVNQAHAINCNQATNDLAQHRDICAAMQAFPCTSIQTFCPWTGTCEMGPYNGFPGGSVPACGRRYFDQSQPSFTSGFYGNCPSGDAGPNVEHTGGPGDPMPSQHCNGPCTIESTSCTSVGPLPDGSTNTVCATEYTGDRCLPGGPTPPAEDSPNESENCATGAEVNGNCVEVDDMDSDPSSSPGEPAICLGGRDLCNEVPPNPNHAADCEVGAAGAVCVGNPNAPNSAPAPPSPPYPPGQGPDWSGNSNSANGSTPVNIYGPPDDGDAGPPDENGNCPSGTTNNGQGSCMCPSGQSWNGSACYGDSNGESDGVCDEQAENDPDCEDGERTAEYGNCGETPPACSGDEIDCSILRQTWATRCALLGTEDPPDIDLDADPLDEYGGADALFGETDSTGPGELDEGGFLGGGGCPTMAPINVLGFTLVIPSVWCELGWLGTLLVSLAYLAAIRIVYGD